MSPTFAAMVKMMLRWCIAALLVCNGWAELKNPYCVPTQPGTVGGTGPSLPSLPNTFQTIVEANFINTQVSMDVKEYFDATANRGAYVLKTGGSEIFMVYSYDTNELFQDTMICKTTNLTGNADKFVFGETDIDGAPHIFTSNGAMRFGSKFGEKYIGQDQIRGINVDHWQACIYWESIKAYFTVDYYFTMKNWTAPIHQSQIPVRAWVQGVGIDVDGHLHAFNHYYDYFAFAPGISDPTVFETPKGIVCPDRIVTMDVPKLTGQYSYREEIIFPSDAVLQTADVWYDSNYKLVRYDYRTEEPMSPFYTTNPLSEIHDYNTGVSYAIDKVQGNCTMTPLENNSFDVSLNYSQTNHGQYVEQMRSSLGLFYLDDNYSYEGQRTIAGIVCDVFISRRTDFIPDPSFGIVNSTFEYYFLAEDWSEIAQTGLDEGTRIPIRLEVNTFDDGYYAVYNFFDFDQEHPDLNNFDITPCFNQDQRIDMQITFPGDFVDDVEDHLKYFELDTRLKIAELANISPIRVQHSSVKYNYGTIFYRASMLETAPPTAKFHKYSGQVLEYNNDKTLTDVATEDDCSYLCLSETSFNCLSFDLCPQKRICYLSKLATEDGTLVGNDVCSHYSRNVRASYINEVSLSNAYLLLKDNVYRDMLTIILSLGSGESQTYVANSIREDITLPDNINTRQLTGNDNIKQFFPLRNFLFLGNADNVLTQVSVDDCATACVDEDLFVCQAFEYNFNNARCELSSRHPSQRTYMHKFTKVPGTVMLGQSDMVYQKVVYSTQCAKLCVDLHEFPCKSFDYCPDEQACILGRTHMLDIPEENKQADPGCDHYSRNYFDDFKFMSGKEVALKNNMIVEGVTLAECSKLCGDQGDSCMGFDFCGNDTICRITSDSVKNVGQVTILDSSYCDHYARQYYTDGSKVTAYSVKNSQDSNLKYSAGAMTGLAFGVLIFGCLITLAAAIAFRKFKAPAPSPTEK
ncbi:uncharacterized protein LOC135470876 [Liolophura sinensis]|uniref:uncharacterized protein LOC135470876 n=1 Tax=Liolophura sinensis TaxID=3198878 RepID=UPI0031584339